MDASYRFLNRFNIVLGFLHLFQGIAVVMLSRDFSLPITSAYLAYDPVSQKLLPTSVELFTLSLPMLIAVFFFLSAAFHFSIATWYRPSYEDHLSRNQNKARWYEYALSASVMMVAISLLVGMYNIASLGMVFLLIAGMNLMGLIMETHNKPGEMVNWTSYWVGCLLGIGPWLAIALYLWTGYDNGSSAPTFVYWIFGSIFLFFNCFALNMWLQYQKIGPWKNYLFGEKTYMVLSLVAKSLLAWQVFAGTLRP